jgi:hypothetical protein
MDLEDEVMSVRYEMSTGWPSQVLESLRRAVAAYVRSANGFKIGRTSTPASRFSQAYSAVYDEMVVIYETGSSDHADEVESELVEFFTDSHNFVAGGGGPVGPSPHFVYVVIER